MKHRLKISQLSADAFPSETALATTSTERTANSNEQRWNSYFEFIAFCIGKHSSHVIYLDFESINFIQDFLIYLLVGIPVCYIQLILGQYTNVGIFLIRKMLPLAQGISYVYFLTIFTLTIIIVIEMDAHLVYFLLALDRSRNVWTICPPQFADQCWDFAIRNCTTQDPCITEDIKLPTYIFWNYTYMNGTLPEHKSKFGMPEINCCIIIPMFCWLIIYFLTIVSFERVKRTVKITVIISVLLKIAFILKYGWSLGFKYFFVLVLTVPVETWFSQRAWVSSISRVISSMMLGDFTYIMFGVYTTYKTRTGTMSFIGAVCGYFILFAEIIIIKGALTILTFYSKINPSDAYRFFFIPHAPNSLIIVPASLALMENSIVWTIIYFASNIITYLTWSVINITFMQQSLYQRFADMQSYYKYVCPTFCVIGCTIDIFIQSKEIYEVRFDLTLIIDSFCQRLNLILLTVMVVFIYGFNKLGDDIQFMTGKQPSQFWKISWMIAPFVMGVTIPTNIFDRKHRFFSIRICTIVTVFSPLLIFGCIYIIQRVIHRDLFGIVKPDPSWGPLDPQQRMLRNDFNPRKQTKYRRYDQKCPHQCLLKHNTFMKVLDAEEEYDTQVICVIEAEPKEGERKREPHEVQGQEEGARFSV